jgi:PQQ-like domain
MRAGWAAAIVSAGFARGVPAAPREAWPIWHGDLQRSGFYSSFPEGKLQLRWRHDLSGELTGPRAEVIISDGLAFMGTYAGNLFAWDAVTGDEKWRAILGSPIGHSVAVGGGGLYVAAMDGKLRALDAVTGKARWSARGNAGFWNSPTFANEWVFIGDRAGVFHAFDGRRGGMEVWSQKTEGPILTPASITVDGSQVVFASEDMHVYCCQTNNGTLVWKSKKLAGLSLRDYAPTIFSGLVFVTTNPVKDFHAIMGENEQMLVRRTGFTGKDARFIPGTDEDVALEQDFIVEFLKAHPSEQCFHVLRLQDGAEPWVAPILYTGGCHNPMTPPCFNPGTGDVFVHVRSAYGVWDGGGEVRSFTGFGRLDIKTGRVALLRHGYPSKNKERPAGAPDIPWSSFNYIGDETQTLSCAPGWLFSNHQGFLGAMNLETGKLDSRWGERDTYAGFFGPAKWGWENAGGPQKAAAAGEVYALINEWHGPARSIASVAGNRIYYHSGSQILCLEPKK